MTSSQVQSNQMLFEVRDYECDMQGIVNNAVYQNYLEHARHKFIKTKGLDFAKITEQGINLVLMRAEIDYKRSLKSGDEFYIETHAERESKLKFAFYQKVVRSHDQQVILQAKMLVASTNQQGRPIVFDKADKLFE
ncbi:acyl-CoA thioesterase [Marinomonas aquiplantarum]|uniref:Acyl-CoA thioester hydrolase n=1 Tax=Marinomonas aquiplantarum TaxID=491951 RepID=A0A366D069_9GAMM|nr:acyl-CoA thioesterase [Marinomonas aquiplantarum]RBO82864.1 acyl-CoA thioester hydrolase [Marinomonas aquiplantarum]